jgi:parvulin-like peptidyl-prolyl isomerase
MDMKTRLLFLPLLIMLVASLAACGGGSQAVPADSVAVVNGVKIPHTLFQSYYDQAVAQAKLQGQQPPAIGTPQYTQLRDQVVTYLVNTEEWRQAAPKEGVSVTDKDVTQFIQNLVKTNYSGSEAKFEAFLKSQGLTMQQAREEVGVNLLTNRLQTKVTADAKVTTQEERQYFHDNPTLYPPTRSVEHILVKQKSLAESLERQLKNGASFAKLAKTYSKDTGSAAHGGKYTATQGKEVPAYDQAAFALKTGELSGPVDATSPADGGYGWFLIKALGPVKTPTFLEEQTTIQSTLLQQKQQALWSQWLEKLAKQYQGKVSYQTNYAPPTTTALSTTLATTTTG